MYCVMAGRSLREPAAARPNHKWPRPAGRSSVRSSAGLRIVCRTRFVARRGRPAQLEHGPSDVSEVDLPLTMCDQHPMRAQEIGAEQHGMPYLDLVQSDAASLAVGRVLVHVAKSDLGIPDRLVANREALKRADPGVDRVLAHSGAAAAGDDAGRFQCDPNALGIGLVEHREGGTRIQLRLHRLPIYLDDENDLRVVHVDLIELHFAGAGARPIRQWDAVAIFRLE